MRLGNRQLVTGLLGWEVSEVTGVGVRGHQTQDHYKSCQFVVNNRKNAISAGNTQRTPNGFVNLRGKVSPLLWGDF